MLFLDVTTPILFLCLNIYEKCFAQDMTCMKKQKEFKKEFVKKKKKKVLCIIIKWVCRAQLYHQGK